MHGAKVRCQLSDKKKQKGRRSTIRRPGGKRGESKQYTKASDKPVDSVRRTTTAVWRREHRTRSTEGVEDALERAAAAVVGPGGFLKVGDIPAYRLGRELRNRLYSLANSLDQDERPNLCARLKQAATSVTASVATGFGEGTFRSAVSRALEARGALYAIQDHLQQAADLGMLEQEQWHALSAQVDDVIRAVNEYLGLLVRERNRLGEHT